MARLRVQQLAGLSLDAALAAQAVEFVLSGEAEPLRREVIALMRIFDDVEWLQMLDNTEQYAWLIGNDRLVGEEDEPRQLLAQVTTQTQRRPGHPDPTPTLEDAPTIVRIINCKDAVVIEDHRMALVDLGKARGLADSLRELSQITGAKAFEIEPDQAREPAYAAM